MIWLGILLYIVALVVGLYKVISLCRMIGKVLIGDVVVGLMCFVPILNVLFVLIALSDMVIWERDNG